MEDKVTLPQYSHYDQTISVERQLQISSCSGREDRKYVTITKHYKYKLKHLFNQVLRFIF